MSLGETMQAEYSDLAAESFDDTKPLQVLIRFLKFGKRWSIGHDTHMQEEDGVEIQLQNQKEASYFTLPTSLWKSEILIKSGTLGIIFCGTSEDILKILEKNFSKLLRDNLQWQQFCDNAKNYFHEQIDLEKKYYLKVPCMHVLPVQPMYDAWGKLQKLDSVLNLYPVQPFSSRNFGVILMNDCGSRLDFSDTYKRKTFEDTCRLFLPITSFSEESLTKVLPHGDTLPHNMVYDEGKNCFTLIDLDEGISIDDGTGFYLRENTYEDENGNNWLNAMYYPNYLRKHPDLYTKMQLVASFVVLMRDKEVNNEDFTQIEENAKVIGKLLHKNDCDNKKRMIKSTIDENQVNKIKIQISSLYSKMKDFCKKYTDGD